MWHDTTVDIIINCAMTRWIYYSHLTFIMWVCRRKKNYHLISLVQTVTNAVGGINNKEVCKLAGAYEGCEVIFWRR